MAAKHNSTLSDFMEVLALGTAFACAGYLVVVCFSGCSVPPHAETHQPAFVTSRPAPSGRQGYMAVWEDGSVSMIELDKQCGGGK